jgi:hypothetical protein
VHGRCAWGSRMGRRSVCGEEQRDACALCACPEVAAGVLSPRLELDWWSECGKEGTYGSLLLPAVDRMQWPCKSLRLCLYFLASERPFSLSCYLLLILPQPAAARHCPVAVNPLVVPRRLFTLCLQTAWFLSSSSDRPMRLPSVGLD